MSEDRERNVQDWFKSSVEELPRQPFTLAVLDRVRRRERHLQLQLYAARLVAFVSFCLLLPELIPLFNMLAALPVTISGEQLLLLAPPAAGLTYWFVRMAPPVRWFAYLW